MCCTYDINRSVYRQNSIDMMSSMFLEHTAHMKYSSVKNIATYLHKYSSELKQEELEASWFS